ncbi:MAG TPA: hypothetical protein VIL34_19025 [Actinopolymorphaceae bacterium]
MFVRHLSRTVGLCVLTGALLAGLTACRGAIDQTSHPAATTTGPRTDVGAPRPPSPPATTAGSLSKDNLPPARLVGPTFTPYAEPDAPEAGLRSNGSSVRERDPTELTFGLVPLGCPGVDDVAPLPAPSRALEQAYRTPKGEAAVALVLEYASEAQASRLVGRLVEMLERCVPPASAEVDVSRTVAHVRRLDADTVVDSRYEVGPGAARTHWDEIIIRHQSRVGLLIVERDPGQPTADQAGLARHFRRLLAK